MISKDFRQINIGEIFHYGVERNIEGVVKVDDDDPNRVSQELDEYVLTPILEKYYYEITEKFLSTRSVNTDKVGVWISGFFGSGKSHFMKILGYILENKKFGNFSASDKFLRRTEDNMIPANLKSINKFLPTVVVMFQIKAEEDQLNPSSVSEIILRQFHKKLGYSENPWIAELEKSLELQGKFDIFKKSFEKEYGKKWVDGRNEYVFVRAEIVKTLHKIFPEKYLTMEKADQGLRDLQEGTKLSPSILADKLLYFINNHNTGTGPKRLCILLDEIGQYVVGNDQKLLELQSIIEELGMKGKGKIWLIVTAQEKLDDVIHGVKTKKAEFSKILSRFDTRFDLTSEKIEMVIEERVLKKKPDMESVLTDLYDKFSGSINSSTRLKDNSRPLPDLEPKSFVNTYPFLPYQMKIIQDIFTSIRSKGGGELHLTGRERSMLAATQGVFIHKPSLMKERSIGAIVTIDMIYDEIESEIEGDIVRTIRDSANLDKQNGNFICQILKALFLMQNVPYMPRSLENLTTLMYNDVETIFADLRQRIEGALLVLTNARLVGKTADGYKFLSGEEVRFEEKIDAIMVKPSDIRRETRKLLAQIMNHTNVSIETGQTFNVKVYLDEEQNSQSGYITFKIYSPIAVEYRDISKDSLVDNSRGDVKTVSWVGSNQSSLSTDITSLIKITTILSKFRSDQSSQEERDVIKEKEKEVDVLKSSVLASIKKSLLNGIIIYRGKEELLEGKFENINNVFIDTVRGVLPNLYPYLDKARVKAKETDIDTVLQAGLSSLSSVFDELSLLDENKRINLSAPIISSILDKINTNTNQGIVIRGKDLIEYFSAPPYGWSQLIVRLAVASLMRNGNIEVIYEQKPYSDYTEGGVIELFSQSRKFEKISIRESISLSPQERIKAREILDEIFDNRPDDNMDSIYSSLKAEIQNLQLQITKLKEIISHYSIPLENAIEDIEGILSTILKSSNSTKAIKTFIENYSSIREFVILLKKINEFISNDYHKEFAEIPNFITNIWNGTQTSFKFKSQENELKIENILTAMKRRDFIDRWIDIQTEYHSVLDDYFRDYEGLHIDRSAQFNQLLTDLYNYPGFKSLEKNNLDQILLPIKRKVCNDLIEFENFVCKNCKEKLTQIQENIEGIESFKNNATSKAESLQIEGLVGEKDKVKKIKISSLVEATKLETQSDIELLISNLSRKLNDLIRDGSSIVVE